MLATKPQADPLAGAIRRLRGDIPLFCRSALKIQTKGQKLVPFELNRAQRIVDEKITAQKAATGRVRAIVLKARQEGISTYVAARFFHAASLHTNTRAMVIADEGDRSGILFDIYDRYYRELPADLHIDKRTSLKRKKLSLVTDSEIVVETAGDLDAGRAMTVHRLHISELAAWKKAADTMVSVLQSVPPEGSEIVIESTAKGVGNDFHRRWEAAESGRSGWLAIFLPWWIHEEYRLALTDEERAHVFATLDDYEREVMAEGIEWEGERHTLTAEQIAWRRRMIAENFEGDDRGFRQEYPATAREAFLVSGAAFFDEEGLLAYEKRATKALARGDLIRTKAGIAFRRAERGYLRIWEPPASDGRYVIGGDTAEGKEVAARATSFDDPGGEHGGRDFSCADVIRLGYWATEEATGKKRWVPPKQVAQLHGRMAPELFADMIYGLGHWYSSRTDPRRRTARRPALVGIERNHGSGQTVLKRLREKWRYPNLFWRRRMNRRTNKPEQDLGWWTDAESRPVMLDTMAADIRNGTIEISSPETLAECFTFVRNDKGRPEAQEGAHDDRVISFAIARQMIEHHRDDPVGEPPEPEVSDTPTGW